MTKQDKIIGILLTRPIITNSTHKSNWIRQLHNSWQCSKINL